METVKMIVFYGLAVLGGIILIGFIYRNFISHPGLKMLLKKDGKYRRARTG